MDTASSERNDLTTPRPAFARWLGTTNNVTQTFLAAGRIPGLINIAGGLPAPETYPAAELATIARKVIEQHSQATFWATIPSRGCQNCATRSRFGSAPRISR